MSLVNSVGNASYGSRLMPRVVDQLAVSFPTRIYATIPRSTNLAEGFEDITFQQVAHATDFFAHWIESKIGCSKSFETVAYMGIADLRYAVFFLAAVKCGYKVLLPSIRNPPWMNASLLRSTACSKFFYPSEIAIKATELQQEAQELELFTVCAFKVLLESHSDPYLYEKSYEEAKWDPILVLHSSGSTGRPKPIVMNHATFAVNDHDRLLPTVPGRKNQNYSLWDFSGGGRFFSPFPPFHLAGFSSMLPIPIYSKTSTLVLAPPDRPPNGQLVVEIMKQYPLKAIFCPPSIAEMLVQEPTGIDLASNLIFFLYAGGPLSQATGKALSEVTDVCQFYGQSETGPVQALVPQRQDWDSLEWHPQQEVEMQLYKDDIYEMVMHRNPALEKIRALSCNFPDVEEWHTKDLFQKHPSKPNLWQFYSRVDDIIVLSNGEKFNPVPSEITVQSHHMVSGAMILGQGRFQPALLIELSSDTAVADHLNVIDDIWPTVEVANKNAQAHGRILRSMILIARPDKPFERAAKGTIVRGMTAQKYADEVEELYTQERPITFSSLPSLKVPLTFADIHQFVHSTVCAVMHNSDLPDDTDLFVRGIDSLKTIELATLLKAAFKHVHPTYDLSWISGTLIYSYPTSESLSNALFHHFRPDSHGDGPDMFAEDRIVKMKAMITRNIEPIQRSEPAQTNNQTSYGQVVLLTGSTGFLGRHILRHLFDDRDVLKIYCLDRSQDAESRLATYLGHSLGSSKVTFLKANLGEPRLGLSSSLYQMLLDQVDTCIHNAWAVNFNHSLDTFEPEHISGVRNLTELSTGFKRAHIIFVSSISSVGNWASIHPKGEPVPEQFVEAPEVALPMGYAEAKYVGEAILNNAAHVIGSPVSIMRIGQICGPKSPDGAGWKEDEWFPSLIKTSLSMGMIPEELPPVDWIPVDTLAAIVGDIASNVDKMSPCRVFNIVNPSPISFSTLLPHIERALSSKFKRVSLARWVEELEELDVSDLKVLEKMPSVKILDFYKSLDLQSSIRYETSCTSKASRTFKEIEPIQGLWLEKWIKAWDFSTA